MNVENPSLNPVLATVTAFVTEKNVERAVGHLTDDVQFSGPLLSVRGRNEYRALLEQFLAAHVETRIMKQFASGSSACSINELVVRAPSGELLTLSMAEWFELRGDHIAEHRVFYDPRAFARAFGMS